MGTESSSLCPSLMLYCNGAGSARWTVLCPKADGIRPFRAKRGNSNREIRLIWCMWLSLPGSAGGFGSGRLPIAVMQFSFAAAERQIAEAGVYQSQLCNFLRRDRKQIAEAGVYQSEFSISLRRSRTADCGSGCLPLAVFQFPLPPRLLQPTHDLQ